MSGDRNLLLGILALQNNFIDRHQLVGAFDRWTGNKSESLGRLLLEAGAIAADELELLEALVAKHLQRHNGDAEKSLAQLTSVGSVRDELRQLADSDLNASLQRFAANKDDDLHRTQPWTASEASSSGSRFRILRPHARGGLGEVYVARDEELHREVALKEIQERHAHDPESRARFLLEAEITGGLEHPGIVPVYGLGAYADGRPFYAMRFIKGDSLKEAIERFHDAKRVLPLPPHPQAGTRGRGEGGARPIRYPTSQRADKNAFCSLEFRKLLGRFVDVCNAIAYAHSRGVLHRDLKPGNIMLGKYGETLVVDWGLAKLMAARDERLGGGDERTLHASASSGSSPTQMGSAVGTPQYMSPEQAEGRLNELGPASDVYSLGATLYTILTGQPAFRGGDLGVVLVNVAKGDFPPPRAVRSDIPRALEAVCLKAMSLRAADRYTSPRLLADDIEHWLADEPVTALPEGFPQSAGRWLRRHRAWALSAAAALVLITTVSILAALGIDAARRGARFAEANAKNEAIRADAEATAARLAEGKSKQEADRADREAAAARVAEGSAKQQAARADKEAAAAKAAEAKAKQEAARADGEAEVAKRAEAKANEQTELARDRELAARWSAYVPNMNEAWRAWETGYIGRALDLLEQAIPERGQKDLRGFEWYLLWQQCHGETATLRGHKKAVNSVAWSPDGKTLASASDDKTVILWNIETRQPRQKLRHKYAVSSIAFSPDGALLATAANDDIVRIFDTAALTEQRTLPTGFRYTGTREIAFSPDGRFLVTGHPVRIWDVATWREWAKPPSGERFAISPDSQTLLTGSGSYGVELHDLDTRIKTGVYEFYGRSFAFAQDSQRIFTGGHFSVWDRESGSRRHLGKTEVIGNWIHHAPGHESVVISPDGRSLGAGGGGIGLASLELWNPNEETLRRRLVGHVDNVSSLAFSPCGKWLASSAADSTVKLWSFDSPALLTEPQRHQGMVLSVAISPDGLTVLSGGSDRAICVWRAGDGKLVKRLRRKGRVFGLAYSPDGRAIATASPDYDEGVHILDSETFEDVAIVSSTTLATSAVFDFDGKLLITGGHGVVRLIDSASGRLEGEINAHDDYIYGLSLSSDGRWLATSSDDRTAAIINLHRRSLTHRLAGHAQWVGGVTFLSKDNALATASVDGTVKI